MSDLDSKPPQTSALSWNLFHTEAPYGMALMRILLPLVLLESCLRRWWYVEELYSTAGVPIELTTMYGYTNFFPPLAPFWAASVYTLLILFLVCASIGWNTRLSLIAVFVLHTGFALNDTAASLTKFTVISTHALLLLCCSQAGRIWSVDAWLARRRAAVTGQPLPSIASPIWPVVMLHGVLGMMYLGASITKFHTPGFFTGEPLMYWILSNAHIRYDIGDWMSNNLALLAFGAHLTMLMESSFLLICWRRPLRYVALFLGLSFHLIAIFTLGEMIFFLTMASIYTATLRESEYRALGRALLWCATRVGLTGWPLPQFSLPAVRLPGARTLAGLQAGLMVAVSLGCGWINYSLDPLHIRHPDGPLALRQLSPEEAAALVHGNQAVRESDKILKFDVGTMLISGRLVNQRTRYRVGDTVYCEVCLNPPHEDMFVECNLCDAEGKLITRVGNISPREATYAQFHYNLSDALVPGKYYLVVRSRNQDVDWKEIELLPSLDAPVAN